MIKLPAITALVLLVSVPVPGENLPTDSHYLIFHAYDAEDRIYDLADPSLVIGKRKETIVPAQARCFCCPSL